jgi:hypothetical protein
MRGILRSDGIRRRFIAVREPGCGNGLREGEEECDGGRCCDASCRVVEGCSEPCRSGADCPRGTACAKRPGDCDGEGVCRQPPAACEEVLEPVCACDGRTYVNACEAARVGKTVRAEDECGQQCGTIAGLGCPAALLCEFPAADVRAGRRRRGLRADSRPLP